MSAHATPRRSPLEWLREDFSKAVGARRLGRLIRREPGLLVWPFVYAGVAVALVAVALLVLGRFDLFASFGLAPAAVVGGGCASGRFERALAKYPDLRQ